MKGFTFLKAAILGLFVALSPLGLAQELESNSEMNIVLEEVNINHADAETIALVLDGIGISKANAIVAYRDKNGSFSSVEDLIMVKGIGEFTVLNNQSRIVFD